MKKVLYLFILSLILTSCLEYNEKMKINSDRSGELTFAFGINQSFFEMGDKNKELKDFNEEKLKESYSKQKGIKLLSSKSFVENGIRWIEISLQFESVDALNKVNKDSTDNNFIGTIKLYEDDQNHLVYERSLGKVGSDSNSVDSELTKGLFDAMIGKYEWKYELTLPGKIISANTDFKNIDQSNNKVFWKYSLSSINSSSVMKVVYQKPSSINLTMILLLVILSIVLGIVLLVLIKKKKDDNVLRT